MSDSIDYGVLMHRAMRGLIQEVMEGVRDNGLPGEHHFFVTFDTNHVDAKLAVWLTERYPDEMTVVIQHWFDNLEVTDKGFGITLNFGDDPEDLFIPYDAIKTFVDPSVEFGLRFETQEETDAEITELTPASEEHGEDEDADTPETDAEVVSLDSFRK